MRNYFLTVLLIITLLLSSEVAFGSCAVKPSIEVAAKGASIVFIGTVTKITPAQKAGATYSIMAKKPKWERRDEKVDVVTFSVSEAFKGVSSETIDVTTGADGFAGYKFEGGTWLKEGQTYLVYAYERSSSGAVPDFDEDEYEKGIAAELRAIHKAFPKKLATEIDEFNSKISPYESNVCMRTTNIGNATEELEQIRKMFPEAKRFSTQAGAQQINGAEAETATFLSRLLSLGLREAGFRPAHLNRSTSSCLFETSW
ncbi:MAG TPA: hypothetical protein VK308_08155 [Pyrinomonadaceae bacterium]|nr:hypothetical protein [Pyrinomonadaceae bacterium]